MYHKHFGATLDNIMMEWVKTDLEDDRLTDLYFESVDTYVKLLEIQGKGFRAAMFGLPDELDKLETETIALASRLDELRMTFYTDYAS